MFHRSRSLLPGWGQGKGLFLRALILGTVLDFSSLQGGPPAPINAGAGTSRTGVPKPLHPALILKDEGGQNVLSTKRPVSTRQSCGKCHDYEFITDSLHFQQGKTEMNPSLLKDHGMYWTLSQRKNWLMAIPISLY